MNGIRITTIVTIIAIALGLTAGGCETGASRGKLAKLKKDYPICAVPLTDVKVDGNGSGNRGLRQTAR